MQSLLYVPISLQVVEGLREDVVEGAAQALAAIARGDTNRKVRHSSILLGPCLSREPKVPIVGGPLLEAVEGRSHLLAFGSKKK